METILIIAMHLIAVVGLASAARLFDVLDESVFEYAEQDRD